MLAEETALNPTAAAKRGTCPTWPSRLRRKMAAAASPRARADAEAEERARWLHELKSQICETELRLFSFANDTSEAASVWNATGQGLMARTLRRRIRDWRKLQRYEDSN